MKSTLSPAVLTCIALFWCTWNTSAITITNGSFEVLGFTHQEDKVQLDDNITPIVGWQFSLTYAHSIAAWVKAPTYSVDDGSYT